MFRQPIRALRALRTFPSHPGASANSLLIAPRHPVHRGLNQLTKRSSKKITQSRPPTHQVNRPFTTTHRTNRQQYHRFTNTRQPLSNLLQAAKPHHFVFLGLTISGLYLYNTDEVPQTGRRRFNCVSRSLELKTGIESYRDILNAERGKVLPDNHPVTRMVDGVLRRLVGDAEGDWRVHVIQDDGVANAFVLPGYVLVSACVFWFGLGKKC
jgi:hypothetical protein